MTREYTLRYRQGAIRCRIGRDASPFGFGGYMLDEHGRVLAYWADALSSDELQRFGASW